MATKLPQDLSARVTAAVRHFWDMRGRQTEQQQRSGRADHGARSAVTGGVQMDGFVDLFAQLISDSGMPDVCIFRDSKLELPGFYRPTKEWDLLVVRDGQLVCVLEAKSQVGPSFGNNFNNRTEEAIGSAVDLWTAYREQAFNSDIKPWLGYLFLLEDCSRSQTPVKVQEPHFKVFSEFKAASYAKRYELLCRKLVRENLYNSAAFLLSSAKTGARGEYAEPAPDLTLAALARSLVAQVAVHSP
ncbi:MAG: restriction endonuclease [candidate division WOR-3 bacterium]|nr:restriction endonuclease [candidate division WOR-3 bacterium]